MNPTSVQAYITNISRHVLKKCGHVDRLYLYKTAVVYIQERFV
ncbi:MAG: hypothetical protein ACFFDY_01045 [Candidatus Thorarchaeota archaeon]